MALLNKILVWSETNLHSWARDAARRLFEKDSQLDDTDYAELFELLKKEHGIEQLIEIISVPLSKEHLPTASQTTAAFKIIAMRDLCHVNRIPPNQKIQFSESGLTIIYGGNGTGKSGYARVLKKACRARDMNEEILPDMTAPRNPQNKATAVFDVKINGVEQSLSWTHNQSPPEILSLISVFDSRCARLYIDEKQDVEYVPYGLDVLGNLATQVYPEIGRRLEREIGNTVPDNTSFKQFFNDTIAGKFASSICPETTSADLDKNLEFTKANEKRLSDIISQLNQTDPVSKAKEHHRLYERLKELIGIVKKFYDETNSQQLQTLEILCNEYNTAKNEEMIAASNFRAGDNLLPGTGEGIWKELFESARKFSVEVAHKDHVFPNLDKESLCPLCQEPLENGLDRLKRFDEYIKNTASQKVQKKNQEINNYKKIIEAKNYSITVDRSLSEDDIIDRELISLIQKFEAELKQFQKHILDAIDARSWSPAPRVTMPPISVLRSKAARQLNEERKYKKLSNKSNVEKLKQEQRELLTRRDLNLQKASIQRYIDIAKRKKQLESCRTSLDTSKISKHAKKLSSEAITDELRIALEREFKRFRLDRINVILKDSAEKGKMKHQLQLEFLKSGEGKIRDILSEGEQRAIALGAFLAELNLSNSVGGIVFDDPVSSLDHWRRKIVAERLVEETSKRQVVVFTHDTVFLSLLQAEANKHNIDKTIIHLEHCNQVPGHVRDGLPWEHEKCSERIHKLEILQRDVAKNWQTYPNEEQSIRICNLYGLLRATVERMIQDVVFCGVVKRYEDWIAINGLKQVIGFSRPEHDAIAELYQKCNELTSAHDSSSAKNLPAPEPSDFLNDLKQFRAIMDMIATRKNQIP